MSRPARRGGEARRRGTRAAAVLLLCAAGLLLPAGCVPSRAPIRRELAPAAPPPPPATAPAPPSTSLAPPPGAPGVRPVRVRLEGIPSPFVLSGESMRVWNAAGRLLGIEGGTVRLSAAGSRIAWGGAKLFESPLDVSAAGGLLVQGKRVPGRIRIAARQGRLRVVAVVPLELYVAAVVSREAAPTFLPEALSAIAVAVRSYTLSVMTAPRDSDYDVVGGVEDQVFEGVGDVDARFRAAAERTRGQVLLYRGTVARTVYHSTCGGRTEDAAAVWGTDVPYLRSVDDDDDCRDSPVWRWEYYLGLGEAKRVALALGVPAGDDLRIEIAGRTRTGRAARIRLISGGVARQVKAADFRRTVGYTRMRSVWVEIVPVAGGWRITGRGYGHGVGMCEWGANGMAKKGATYPEILARYYPLTRLALLPSGPGPLAAGAEGTP